MTFVFASALAAVLVLILSISRISPLDRTQIFFLTTSPRDLSEIRIKKYTPNANDMRFYKESFIREYIRQRNDIFPSLDAMQRKWREQVFFWSSVDVYSAFTKTNAFNAIMSGEVQIDFRCFTEMLREGVTPLETDATTGVERFMASFRYVCANQEGTLTSEDYSVLIGVRLQDTVQWSERLQNPLGVYVTEYKLMDNAVDPLNTQLFNLEKLE
jgi:type IV secretory pathway component VirB8